MVKKMLFNNKKTLRERRHNRIRAKIMGTKEQPRLVVFRSSRFIYAQLVNDEEGKVLASASDLSLKKGTKIEKASKTGQEIAKKAKNQDIQKIVFDRAGYQYHGRVQALAEAARKGGLKF